MDWPCKAGFFFIHILGRTELNSFDLTEFFHISVSRKLQNTSQYRQSLRLLMLLAQGLILKVMRKLPLSTTMVPQTSRLSEGRSTRAQTQYQME